MITLSNAAKTILERRHRLSSIIQSGQLQLEIGPENFAEALRRRWIVPDIYETGALQVTNNSQQLCELEAAANDKLAVGDSVTLADSGKSVVGVVREVRPDGRIVVSFGDQKPQSGKTDFAQTELKKNDPSAANRSSGSGSPFTQPPPVGSAHP